MKHFFQRAFQRVFPPPRRPVTWRSAVPLVVFLVVYAALCIGLELSDTLLFSRRAAFGLMVFTLWIWWMHVTGFNGLSWGRALSALITRLSLAGLFVMMLAEPRAVRTSDTVSVIYAVDISDSIGDGSTDKALEFVVRTVAEKPEKDEAGLITFGRNAAVELPPRTSFPFEALNAKIDRDATNLEQSLSLAAAMLPEESRGRIVLITDGTQTAGNLTKVVDELKSREIAVDILPIEYEYDREVWIERLELPQFVKIGETYEASVVLSSLQAGKGKLVIQENGEPYLEEEVDFKAGKNRFTVPVYLREAGYYEYSATIETSRSDDNLTQNNTAINYIFVEGEGRVLLVTDPVGDTIEWQPLLEAMQSSERSVQTIDAYDFPRDPLSLMPYDCVIFNNVGQDAFDSVQLQALHDAVYNQGIGFLMTGGPNSFGPGGYHRTVVEDALPVTMDISQKKVLPKGALAIILHTCEFPEGNTWGKRITKQAIKVLGAQDEVGVLAYAGGRESWIFELTPAGEYEKMVPKINAAQIGDMPSFVTTMELGLKGLKKSDAATKHMIIISDGDPQPPPPALIKAFRDAQVSVSMVAVFPHGGQEVSKMRAVANATGGRYYFPSDPNELPAIFIKESKTLKRSMIQNKTLTPKIGFPSSVLDGIETIPPLDGYVLTTSKPRSENVLIHVPDGEDEGDIDPILAIGRYGLATTAAFTSDLSPKYWGDDWVAWDKYQAFVKQLLIRISRVRKAGHLKMWTYMAGGDGVIMVEDFHPEEMFLEVQTKVSGPRDQSQTVPLKQVGPRRYQATVPLWGKGRYQVQAVGVSGERTDRVLGGFIVPYSPEYLRFRSDPIVLDEVREKTGGVELPSDAKSSDVFNRRVPKQSSRPIFDLFLIALACLIPLDVGIRRVQLDWSVIKGWFGFGKYAQTTKTMSALLERKQTVGSQLKRQKQQPQRPTQGSTPAYMKKPKSTPATSRTAKPPAADKPQTPETPAGDGTTTSKLLDLKRKRQDDDD